MRRPGQPVLVDAAGASLQDAVVSPAASLTSGAEISIFRTALVLESGVLASFDESGIRIRSEGEPDIALAWSELKAFARVHRGPPAAERQPIPGDEVVLGRAQGGIYRGTVVTSDAEAVAIRLANVEKPIRLAWNGIATWACGDAAAPLPADWMPAPETAVPVVEHVPEVGRAHLVASIDVFHGNKSLSQKDWGVFAAQRESGMTVTAGMRAWPVRVTAGHFQASYRFEQIGVLAETRETFAGVRHDVSAGTIFTPWIAGGALYVSARLASADASVSGTGAGFWAAAGVEFRVNRYVRGGLSIRHSLAGVDLEGTELPAGGTHVLLSIGFGLR